MNDSQKRQLQQLIDEILYYVWDPIGISDIPGARDEYSRYAHHVWGMAMDGKVESDIAAYLTDVVVSRMGLRDRREHDEAVAALIINWKRYFEEF